MVADGVSIETARSWRERLDAFRDCAYPGGSGRGVGDLHAPAFPRWTNEMITLREAAAGRRPGERLWVNPDGGRAESA